LFFGKQRYWVADGLKLPILVENHPAWYLHETPDHELTVDNGTILYYLNRRVRRLDLGKLTGVAPTSEKGQAE
jgi:hypothetical protein